MIPRGGERGDMHRVTGREPAGTAGVTHDGESGRPAVIGGGR